VVAGAHEPEASVADPPTADEVGAGPEAEPEASVAYETVT